MSLLFTLNCVSIRARFWELPCLSTDSLSASLLPISAELVRVTVSAVSVGFWIVWLSFSLRHLSVLPHYGSLIFIIRSFISLPVIVLTFLFLG